MTRITRFALGHRALIVLFWLATAVTGAMTAGLTDEPDDQQLLDARAGDHDRCPHRLRVRQHGTGTRW